MDQRDALIRAVKEAFDQPRIGKDEAPAIAVDTVLACLRTDMVRTGMKGRGLSDVREQARGVLDRLSSGPFEPNVAEEVAVLADAFVTLCIVLEGREVADGN